jgi:hypothetical protein
VSLDVPVLLITFRRPEPTAEVVGALRAARPSRLFVAGDGPRAGRPDDAEGVAATRDVIAREVDWPVELRTRFHEHNLGCRRGVVDAIDWFLSEVEEGIVLEDDCVPHPDFFGFCAELLERYRDDERVWSIAGSNAAAVPLAGDASYGFVRTPQVWGWATWRRAWARYDRDLAAWARVRGTPEVERLLPDPIERSADVAVFDRMLDEGEPDTWDYQWFASLVVAEGLCVLPRTNLVANVGFGPDATHTVRANRRAMAPTGPILPLVHPERVVRDPDADRELFDRLRGGAKLREIARRRTLIGRLEGLVALPRRVAGRALRALRPPARSGGPRAGR